MSTANWWAYRFTVTVADVLESGACLDGVRGWVESHRGVIAGSPQIYRAKEIREAANADGDGDGYGYGYGDGYGSGYGDGSG